MIRQDVVWSALRRMRDRVRGMPWAWPSAVILAAMLASGGTLAAASSVRMGEPIQPRDTVQFHMTVFDSEDRVVYTTDAARAQSEIAAGNAMLDPAVDDSPTYGVRKLVIPTERPSGHVGNDARIPLAAFLVGAREGDVVESPFIINPFGVPKTYAVPAMLGPADVEFTVDLSMLYDEEHRARSVETFGERSVFVPGARIPYDILEATVLDVQGDVAWLRVEPDEGDVLRSETLGFPLRVREAGEGKVTLHPVLVTGDVFETKGCKLPVESLPPGRFRVVTVGAEGATVEAAPLYLEHLQRATLRLEFTILEVEPFTPVKAAREWFASALAFS